MEFYTKTYEEGSETQDTVKFITTLNDTFSVNTEVTCTRYNITRCSSSENFYCWAQCYIPIISNDDEHVAPDKLLMFPGVDTVVLSSYHIANGETGDATYRFALTVKGNPDTAFVDVKFEVAGVCTDVGVDEELERNLAVYPNPAQNVFVVNPLEITGKYNIEIVDLLGQNISSINNAVGLTTIDTKSISNGVYFVRLIQKNNIVGLKKIVISK